MGRKGVWAEKKVESYVLSKSEILESRAFMTVTSGVVQGICRYTAYTHF